VQLACAPDDEAAIYDGAGNEHLWTLVGSVGVPVTLVAGERSVHRPAQLLPRLARHLEARQVLLDGLTHFGPLENPSAIARSILDTVSPS
jgi:pimeloyl-ACP methyl ester carboxylesterase